MQTIDVLRSNMVGKRFYKTDPQASVLVVNVCKASRGYQVLFNRGGNTVFCAYTRFIKNFPNEVM